MVAGYRMIRRRQVTRMITDMELWSEVRRRVLTGQLSKRAACREYGIHWQTLEKMLSHAEPPGYRLAKSRPSKLEPFQPIIDEILISDRKVHRKQRHTSKRIFERLRDEHGYEGGWTLVKDAVRAWKQHHQEVFLPLSHPPGEAQVDFGFADVWLEGELTKVALFVMTLPYSVLNVRLAESCRKDLQRQLRGKSASKDRLLEEERRRFFQALPVQTFESHRVVPGSAKSLSLVRFDNNDYSVPTQFAHRPVTIAATVDEVRLVFEDRLVARHQRCWKKQQSLFDPVHYLALLERKPGGFDHARPLEDWELPVCFGILRRRLESELDGGGTRAFIKVLRLLETHSLKALKHAVQHGLEIDATSSDAIRLIIDYQQEEPIALFSLDGRPHLKLVRVAQTDVSVYQSLLMEGATL